MESLVVLLVIKLLGTLGFPIANLWQEHKRRGRSHDWIQAHGQVRCARVDKSERWDLYTASVGYAYSVNGQNYSGLLEMSFVFKILSERYISRLPAGMVVTIRYNPLNPDDSVLLMDDQPMLLPQLG